MSCETNEAVMQESMFGLYVFVTMVSEFCFQCCGSIHKVVLQEQNNDDTPGNKHRALTAHASTRTHTEGSHEIGR
eukprot:3951779-Amphidinium_carterae.1